MKQSVNMGGGQSNNLTPKKKMVVTILLVVALLVLVVGVAFAAFTGTLTSNDNTVNTGRISMSYTEPSNALILENALPMSDEEGASQSKFFEFTVSTHATTNATDDTGITIPYEINISDLTIDGGYQQLTKSFVKVNLVKVDGATETEVVTPTLLSNMMTSTLREGATRVYKTSDTHKNNSAVKVTTYRLRAWLDKTFDITDDERYQYKFSVNVNSQVNAVGVEYPEEPTLLTKAILGDNNSNVTTSGDGLYVSTETNDGRPTYYYRGAVENNYVQFANLRTEEGVCAIKEEYADRFGNVDLSSCSGVNMLEEEGSGGYGVICETDDSTFFTSAISCRPGGQYSEGTAYYAVEWQPLPVLWRVVRINEDGSIRIMLNDTVKLSQDANFSGIEYSYNTNYEGMYYSNSNVKTNLESWYNSNLSSYDNYIALGKFCEQAKVTDSDTYATAGNATLVLRNTYTPDYTCVDDANGYGDLDLKVGLITFDEMMLAGTSSYFPTTDSYWTMSPAGYGHETTDGNYAPITVAGVWTYSSGLNNSPVYTPGYSGGSPYKVAPVINLNANVTVTGNGSSTTPWVVQTN